MTYTKIMTIQALTDFWQSLIIFCHPGRVIRRLPLVGITFRAKICSADQSNLPGSVASLSGHPLSRHTKRVTCFDLGVNKCFRNAKNLSVSAKRRLAAALGFTHIDI